MRIMKGVLLGIIFTLFLTMSVFSASADQPITLRIPQEYSLMYSHTEDISASLSFSGNIAKCNGVVFPIENVDVTVTVSLYKQNGSSWTLLDSWSGSAKNGYAASASGTKTVSSGTYKVVTYGNVGGLEFPTASITKTKP
ncbi:MAG: hypothetical protein J1F18_08945 [Lachnospiraceae bacterium]|nr:hypothetical protein [Lachnospiraceae bacterium]